MRYVIFNPDGSIKESSNQWTLEEVRQALRQKRIDKWAEGITWEGHKVCVDDWVLNAVHRYATFLQLFPQDSVVWEQSDGTSFRVTDFPAFATAVIQHATYWTEWLAAMNELLDSGTPPNEVADLCEL